MTRWIVVMGVALAACGSATPLRVPVDSAAPITTEAQATTILRPSAVEATHPVEPTNVIIDDPELEQAAAELEAALDEMEQLLDELEALLDEPVE